SETKTKEKHDLVKDAARAPALLTWHSLAEAELYARVGRDVYVTTLERPDVNDYPNFRPMIEFLKTRRALTDGDFKSIPACAESTALAFAGINAATLDEQELIRRSMGNPSGGADISKVASFVAEGILC